MSLPQGTPPVTETTPDRGTSIREAARWLTTAFAAVGTVLVAGLQLGSLGGLGTEEPWRLPLALGAVFVALLGTGWMIVRAAHVLITPDLTWTDIFVNHEIPAIRRRGSAQPLLSAGRSHLSYDALLQLLKEASSTEAVPFEGTAAIRRKLESARARAAHTPTDTEAQEHVAALEHAVTLCLTRANAWQSQQLYRALIRTLLRTGVLTAACLVVYAWAANPPPEKSPQIKQPVPVEIHLRATADKLPGTELGKQCHRRTITGVAVGGRLDEPVVAVPATEDCAAARFTVTPELGVAVPVRKP
ncbi:hypothetical protein [Streptomyces syringium]|uniref:hypothetical protein n=1 Tax=Streptomyces syringium TaxID=76729 RepID=UPI003AAD0E67